MACMEHKCFNCGVMFMDNLNQYTCPYCKSPDISNWFDEYKEESPSGDDYDEIDD